MELKDLSICFITEKVKACTAFYQEHFSGKVTFDCGWYVNLEFGDSGRSLQFKEPQGEEKPFAGHGITLNIKVTDVNAVHNRLMSRGLKEVDSLEDHPWGDRGFSVKDPIGNNVYIYNDIEPSEEFARYYREA